MSSTSLRKKLSFRRKKKGGAVPFSVRKTASTESTASCSPPPLNLGSFPVSPPSRLEEGFPQNDKQRHGSQQWSLAQHLKEQQQEIYNPKRHVSEKLKSESSSPRSHSSADNTTTTTERVHHHSSSPRDLWKQAIALDTAGNTLLEQGHYTRAKRTYERALTLKQASLHHVDSDQQHHDDLLASVATSINNIGYLRQRAGASPQDSMAAYQDALAMKQTILGPNSLSVGKTLNNIGSVHYSQQNYKEALSSYQQALNIMEQNLGEFHVDVATVYSNIGDVYMSTCKRNEALFHLRRALEIRWHHLEEHSPKIRRLLEKIAMVEMNSRNFSNNDENGEDRLLMDGEEEQGGVQQELHLLSSQVEADIQQVGDLRRKMALDMVKDKLRILKGMRQIELNVNQEHDHGSTSPTPPSPDSSVRGIRGKTPPPLSPTERRDALSSVKERLAKLREQKSLRSLLMDEEETSSTRDTSEKDDAELERQLGIGHLLELPKLNLDSVLGD